MSQPFRISGGLIDRSAKIEFSFNGRRFEGYDGDTLASALLANGQKLIGRSFKYHRPRGIFSAGSEEPNALVQLGKGAYQEPNTRATITELFEGLEATSQNHLGPLKYDLMAITDLLSPFLSAGFYYKTFMWPKSFWEKVYEPIIRASAGLGSLSLKEDPDRYDKGFLHCDVLIIGAGPAGLAAALTAGRSGARVIVADEDFLIGGRLNCETMQVAGVTGAAWAKIAVRELRTMENVRLMARTTIYGAYDHGTYGALERVGDHLPAQARDKPRQILWKIFSKRAILCAGSTERPISFGNNDRPGIMLAGSVRAYANRWGVAPGKRVAIYTNNDDGWRTAFDLNAKGVEVAAIIDSRKTSNMPMPDTIEVIYEGRIVNTSGRHGLRSLTLADGRKIDADCLAVSGGWNPNLHLTCHQRGRPKWSGDIAAFVPGDDIPPGISVAGAAKGEMTLQRCLIQGHNEANDVASQLGFNPTTKPAPIAEDEACEVSAFWHVKQSKARTWLDFQNDVTLKDIKLAHQEGYRSVEHMKRYTTLGMATDQGKTANVPALAVMAECTGKTIEETGTTIFRPPYTPVAIGAFGGRSRGMTSMPQRLTPSHQWAKRQGAQFVETGLWMRAQWYPITGENHWRQSVDREVLQTRASVGICDVSTLGKIDIQGVDAAEFINKIYSNGFGKLPVGKVRYGLMLREDGIVMDDGTTARLTQNHFLMTTTTGHAEGVFRHLEFCRQCLWPQLDVHLISVTEQFAQFAIAGPNSRLLLQQIIDPQYDISNENFPFMACAEISICGGLQARLFRISFSGELAYEIAVPARFGNALMERLMEVGKTYDVAAYGLEALNVMRIEKGHVVASELNGQTTTRNLGMGRMVSDKKDFIGNILPRRPGLNRKDGLTLMGFRPVNRRDSLESGAHFIAMGNQQNMENDEGWMTSVAFSATLGHHIGLGFIKGGDQRIGEIVNAADPLRSKNTEVEIVSPVFIDPEGERLRG